MGAMLQCQYQYGRTDARIAVVGEAPAREEMAAAQPLVGSSGRYLNDCLRIVGIPRPALYIGNVSRKPNKTGDLIEGKNNRWTGEGLQEYDEFCRRIENIHPTVWAPLGETALFALTGKTGITKWRGSILSCSIPGHEHEKVIPSIHPSHILQGNPIDRALLLSDLKRIEEDQHFPELRLHQATLVIEPSYSEAMEYIEACQRQGIYCSDIEVLKGQNSQMSCISLGLNQHHALSIPFYDGHREDLCYWTIDEEIAIKRRLAQLLEDPDCITIGQNWNFDSTFLYQQEGIYPSGPVLDSMILHRTIYPDLKAGLDILCSLYTRIPYYKDDRKIWERPEKDQPTFWTYNARDSVAPIAVLHELLPDLENPDWQNYVRRIHIYPALAYMEAVGILTDPEAIARVKADAEDRMAVAQAELNELAGRHLNVNSNPQMLQYFYGPKAMGNLGFPEYRHLKTKRPTTDDLALQRIARKFNNREAQLCQIIRSEKKLITSYYDILLDPDNRLRCHYKPRGTKTGRLSSAESVRGTGTNMQNQPEEFKKMIHADPPRKNGEVQVLAELDKKGAEWVVVAYLSRNKNMLEVVEANLDAHVRTGHLISGVPEAVIVAEAKALGHLTSVRELAELRGRLFPDLASIARVLPPNMTIRQMGKKSNHALNYDLGEEAFSIRNTLPRNIAAKIKELYYRQYGTGDYHKWVQDQLREPISANNSAPRKTLTDCFGNRYVFLGPLNDDTFRLAYSFLPQSTVVNMVNRGALEPLMYDEFYQKLRLRAQVHDSVLTAAWIDLRNRSSVLSWCSELARLGLEDMMPTVEYHGVPFQIKTDCKIGTCWADLEEIKLHPDPEKMYDEVMPVLETLYA